MTLAIDVSNYTGPLTAEALAEWREAGVGLVIIQAFPPDYHQYAEQTLQTESCQAAGMPFDNYIYDYLGDPTWRDGCLDGIDLLAKPRMVWLDEEDTETEKGWSQNKRRGAIYESALAVRRRVHFVGGYTGRWWWGPKTGDSNVLAGLDAPLWDSDYDGHPDTEISKRNNVLVPFSPYGGWEQRAIKQFRGTSEFEGVGGVDVNVLSDAEAAELEPPDEPGLELEDDVLIPDEYVQKFGLVDNHDVRGLIDNYEGVINTVREQAMSEGADCAERLAKVREAVGAADA